jgi:outer membrane protein, heavy metal efflux system
MIINAICWQPRRRVIGLAALLSATLGLAGSLCGQTALTPITTIQGPLSRDAAVHMALVTNPVLQVVRQQYGYSEAAIVIAKTYPFNPVYTGYVTSANGPTSAGNTLSVYNEHYISQELEVRGQGGYRRAAACATATKIEWEIANQELLVTFAVIRAYNTLLYRNAKVGVFEESFKLSEQLFEQVRVAGEQGKMKGVDLAMARADFDTLRAQRSQIRTGLAVARSELRKQLGILDDSFSLLGSLDVPLPALDVGALTDLAVDQRPDLRARRAALTEAQASLNLVIANRYGNPSIGPYFELDPTQTFYLGVRIGAPLPVFNQKSGEILKAKTDVAKVNAEVGQLELQASLDVRGALARLADARQWAASYDNDVVPALFKSKQELERMVAKNEPGADPGKLVAVRRALLKATDSQLDAHYEVSQAQVDLALAIADPALALGPGQPAHAPHLTAPDFEK